MLSCLLSSASRSAWNLLERLSTAYFFPANDREGHVTWHFSRLPFAGRRFYSRRTFCPFGGNAETWVFAAHFYCLFLHFDRLLLKLCFVYHLTSTWTACKAKRVSNSSGKYTTSPYPFRLVAVNGDRVPSSSVSSGSLNRQTSRTERQTTND